MTLTVVLGMVKGLKIIRNELQAFTQEGQPGRAERLQNTTSILPRREECTLAKDFMREAGEAMERARGQYEALRTANVPTTRSQGGQEGKYSTALAEAERTWTVAIKNYDDRTDRYDRAARRATTTHNEEIKELETVLSAFVRAVPANVLSKLLPGATTVGSTTTSDGSIVTPAVVIAAMQRYEDSSPRMTIKEAFTKMTAITKALESTMQMNKVSS